MQLRELPVGMTKTLPTTAMYNQIRRESALRSAGTGDDGGLKSAEALIRSTALELYKLRGRETELPDGVKNSLRAIERAFEREGVEIIDYTGRELDDEISERVSIEGWLTGSGETETVQETFTPEVNWRGKVLHQAQIFCYTANSEIAAVEPVRVPEPDSVSESLSAKPETNADTSVTATARRVQGSKKKLNARKKAAKSKKSRR